MVTAAVGCARIGYSSLFVSCIVIAAVVVVLILRGGGSSVVVVDIVAILNTTSLPNGL